MIPNPETIDAAWLTERLREAGHEGVEVRSFMTKRIGTGQIGKCLRYELELAGETDGVPLTLVGKFPSDDPSSRQTGVQFSNFIKEVQFYRELQSRLTIATPKCYFADIDGIGPDFALFLEDLAPASQGDQLAGCSVAIARAAVMQLVGLHAPSWCDATLRGIDWLGETTEMTAAMVQAVYQNNIAGVIERYGPNLADDEVDILQRFGESSVVFQPMTEPYSLIHIDYRLDNLLIDASRTPPFISAVDWQSISLGNPLSDVAYFLGAGLLPEDRRPVEESIVRDYYDALRSAGITDYEWDACWTDYRRGTFSGFVVTVVASMLVEQTERGDEMFLTMARRHARHALDLGAEEFLA